MDKYAAKVLLTPDPRYIPGYAGHCPQLKFHIAKSYGKLTAELLSSPEVKHSNRLVLHTGHSMEPDPGLTPSSIPDSNLKRVIPGYTGFVPRSRNYFACSSSETRHKALTEFYQERLQRSSGDLPAVVNHSLQQLHRPKPPLMVRCDKVLVYKPLKPLAPIGRPYLMDDDNPHKHFISGYMGHVPKSRFLFGQSYPITTNQALIQFRKQQQSRLTSKDVSGRKNSTTPPTPTVRPSSGGVAPSFSGHIPGYRFMHGHTFGELSRNALEKIGINRALQEKSEKTHTAQ